jgi:hypothetical protein
VEGSPNILAWTALVLSAPVSILMVALWRAPVSVPIILIAAQLFLPPMIGFDLPYLFTLDKDTLPAFGALIGCFLFRRSALANSRPGRGLDLFILLRVLAYFGSCMTNRDPLIFPRGTVPALSIFSFMTGAARIIAYWWPTVYLGRTVIKTSRDLRTLLVILASAAVIYSVFIFVEMRFSPQLNNWIYGYHQTNFIQSMKGANYRPMVFMRHGLNVAFFLSVTIIATTALARTKARVLGMKAGVVAIYLFVVLVFCHSLGALIYAALAAPLVWFASARTQTRVAAVFALLAFSYPLARAMGLVPVADINAFVLRNFGEDRAGSLGLRLQEEEYLMNRTLQRVVFGWGGGARSFRLDPITGANTSVTDGLWALEFGQEGAVGFIIYFGMLLYPVWKARNALRGLPSSQDEKLVAGLAVVGAIYIVELIPNSSIDPYLTFMTAVLAGVARRGLIPDDPHSMPVRQAYS